MKNFIKTKKFLICILIASILVVLVIGGFLLFGNNKTSLNDFPNGTYNCELMYDGKSFDSDEVVKAWLEKLATYDVPIDFDTINISDVRKGLVEEFGASFIVKKDNVVTLNLINGEMTAEFAYYDINNKQFNISEELIGEEGWQKVQEILNKSVTIKQTNDSVIFDNFGFVLIYPTYYNNEINNASSENNINLDLEKYTGLGDLVCKISIEDDNQTDSSSKEETSDFDAKLVYKDLIDSYSQYLYTHGESGEILLGTPGWNEHHTMPEAYEMCNINEVSAQNTCESFENIRTYLAYAIYDMDGDGIEELIIARHGSYYDSDKYNPSNEIMAIYYYNKKVKNLYLAPFYTAATIEILEDGYLKYSSGRMGNYTTTFQKKGKSWDKLETVLNYETIDSENGLIFIKRVPGKEDEIHENITWSELSNYDNSYNSVGKFAINLNKLEWNTILYLD